MRKIRNYGYLPTQGDDLCFKEGGCLATIYTVKDARETWESEGEESIPPLGITKHKADGVYDIVLDKPEIRAADIKAALSMLSKLTGEEYEFEGEDDDGQA